MDRESRSTAAVAPYMTAPPPRGLFTRLARVALHLSRLQEESIRDLELRYSDYTVLATLEHQAQQGVDYFTIHAGVRRAHLPLIKDRLIGIVSRGGSLLAKWMIHHGRETLMATLWGAKLTRLARLPSSRAAAVQSRS